ncbi:MAG: hypothetical protein ACTSV7_06360 [Candidatus Baldrarchaeia archaeon]
MIELPDKCPRGLKCQPLSCLEADDGQDFVCVGTAGNKTDYGDDLFCHCLHNNDIDTHEEYSMYDFKSMLSVITQTMMIAENAEPKELSRLNPQLKIVK